MTKQTALDFADLRFIEITCARCDARVSLDAKNVNSRPPVQCSSCGSDFPAIAVQNPVRQFMEVYRVLTQPDQAIRFRVIVDEPAD